MAVRIGIEALKRAVSVIGSQELVAGICGVGQSAVSECLRRGKRVPGEWCIPLENETRARGDVIHRWEFRPDLYPPPSRGQAAATKSRKPSNARFRADKRSAAEARS